MPGSNSSASGDRRDFGGKVPQFELFADKVYVELTKRNLAWVKVGDPKAGNADDIQYATRTEVHAYQVKWSQQANKPSFSYSDFISLLPELQDSWARLKDVNASSGLSVYVYLLTNRPPSKHDRLVITGRKTDYVGSFNEFLNDAWPVIKSGGKPPGNWGIFLEQELKKLNTTEIDFLTFAQYLRLEFNATLPQPLNHRHHDIYQQDVTNLYKFFHNELARLTGQVKFTADELIKEMQWEGRIKSVFSHDFYVDPKIYQPNTATAEALSEAIELMPGGYVFLEGGPGSGKSSLLTQWAADRPEKVIKYFAYLNQTNGNQPIRGEAVNMFHDLSIQLTESGFLGSTVFGVQRDLTQTQQVFQNQLQQVGELYQEQRIKTIIIIDGLDHIPREYAKLGTLLEHLPHPADVPEGVYVVLGSQSFELAGLTVSVRQAVEQPGRRIAIQPLLPIAVSRIADSVLNEQLTPIQHDLLFQASGGHPLFLQYILRTLQNKEDSRSIEERLAQLPPFDQDVRLYYDRMWQEFETDEDIANLLGLVCRLRFGFHFDMRNEWGITLAVARKAKRWFNQFFDESFGFKVFFHNSFRQFLLNKTAEDPLTNHYDNAVHVDYHARLADWSATSTIRLFRHEHLYHVHQAGQIDRFHQTLTPEYVDQQRHTFRPFDSIRDDLAVGLQLAAESQHLPCLLRYSFLIGEMHRREWNMDQSHFLDYFPSLFDLESVTEYALLPINSSERRGRALKIARLLYENGYETDARRLFALAEPAAYAEGEPIVEYENGHYWREQVNTLEEWIRTKCIWAEPDDLVEKIFDLKLTRGGADNEHLEEERQRDEQELQTRLLDALIKSLAHSQSQRRKLLPIFSRFDCNHLGNLDFFLPRFCDVIVICLRDGDSELAVSLLDDFLKNLAPANLSFKQRTLIAQMLYETDTSSTAYQDWIRDIALKPLTEIPFDIRTDGTLDYFLPYFRYVMLETARHRSVDFSVLFPDVPNEPHYDPTVTEWFKMLARTAIIKGEGIRGEQFNGRYLLPILRFYYRPKPDLSNLTQYGIDRSRQIYYRLVVEATATYGANALLEAAALIDTEIAQNSAYWSAELQLYVWSIFLRCGLDEERVIQRIGGITEAVIAEQGDLDSRINQALTLSEIYLKLGAADAARFWLQRAADESFGVGHRKDYQLNDWIDWLDKANDEEPEQARDRIRWLAAYLDHIDQTTDGGAASSRAAYAMLEGCIRWNSAAGLDLFDWLLKRQYVNVDDGINLLLNKLLQGEVSSTLLACSSDLFGKVLLPSSKFVSGKMFTKLIQLLQQREQHDLLDELVEDVERYALQENRPEYYELLRAANVSFSPAKGFPMDKREQSEKSVATVRLQGDSQFTQSEFAKQYATATELKQLIGQVYETSGEFDWQACLQKIEQQIDESWFIQTLSVVIDKRDSSFGLILALGELAYQTGYNNAAKAALEKLLTFKKASWSPFYDGGRRLKAFSLAIKVEGESARKAAWFDFIRQFEQTSSVELLRELDEIIPVLAPSADIRSTWIEIETHLSRMFTHVEASRDVPELAAASIDNEPEALIARLALNFSLLAERGLREVSLVHLAKQTATGNASYVAEVRRFANDTNADIDQEIFAKIALYLGEVAPPVLAKFTNELRKLASSSLFSSRVTANTLLQQLDEPIEPNSFVRRPLIWLNTSFNKLGQEQQLRRFNETISEGWTGNRFSTEHLLVLLRYHLETIAEITSIDEDVLFQRIIDLLTNELQQLTGRLQKLAQGGEVGLESTYYPYAVIVPFLIDQLLNELWEGGYSSTLDELAWLNPIFDPSGFRFKQHRRPEELPGVIGFNDYYTLPSDWIERTEDGFTHFMKKLGDRIVIAERTTFRGLSWDLATERRESCWAFDTGKKSREFYAGAFHREVNLLITDYIDMSREQHALSYSTPLIIANHAERFLDTPTHLSEWIAINPTVADLLGWRLANPSKFEWVDANNDIMVQSFYWVDGNVRMKPPQLRSQAGCGWIVTASKKAVEVLKHRSKLIHKFQLDRQLHDRSSRKPTHLTLQRIDIMST